MSEFLTLLVIVGVLVGLAYALMKPHLVFIVVLIMFPLEQLLQAYLSFFGQFHSFVNYGVGFLALFAIGVRTFRREQVFSGFKNRVTYLTIAYYGLWFAGIFYSPARYWLVDQLTFCVAYQVLYLALLPLLVLDLAEFRRALTGFMIVSGIMAMLVMFNPHSSFYSGRLVLDLGMALTGREATGNPLALAELGVTGALIAAMVKPERGTTWMTLLRAFAFITGMGLAIGSGSRGQVLAAGIAGVLFFPLARRMANPRQFIIMVIGFIILGAGLLFTFKIFVGHQNERRWEVWSMIRDTTLRLDMVWQLFDAYIASPSHWLLGLGTNAYAEMATDNATMYVHNIAAEALCEHGIVGAIMFIAMTWLTVKAGWKLWKMHRTDPGMRSTVTILLAICLVSLLQALKQGTTSFPAPFYWWLILTKLSTHEQLVAAEETPPVHESDEYALADDAYGDDHLHAEGDLALG